MKQKVKMSLSRHKTNSNMTFYHYFDKSHIDNSNLTLVADEYVSNFYEDWILTSCNLEDFMDSKVKNKIKKGYFIISIVAILFVLAQFGVFK